MVMKRLLCLGLLCLFCLVTGRSFGRSDSNNEAIPHAVLAASMKGSEALFTLDNNLVLSVRFLRPDVLKIWMDRDSLSRKNSSFAVVAPFADALDTMAMNETPDKYEFFTGRLIVRVNKQPFRLRIFDKYQKLLLDDYAENGYSLKKDRVTIRKGLRANERFYGLGEKSGSLDRRGQRFEMWNSDNPCYGEQEDPLYKSIPFFMSSYGYGLFFDNSHYSMFDFGATSNEFISFTANGGELCYYFMYGPSYQQLIGHYTKLTGQPIMPPAWGLGFSQSRGMLTNEALTREIAAGFRQHQIPCDIIYQDIGWTQHLQDFEWRKENYLDPVGMLEDLDSMGFKVIVSQDPVISKANRRQWQEADSLGYFATDVRTGKSYDMPWPWGGNCGVVDFTNPKVADWWGAYQQKVLDDGVRGFWTDMGEPAWSNLENSDRLFMRHHLGMHREIHNVYGLTWDQVVTEQFMKRNPNTRIFQMTRAGFAGMQRYTFGWSGDAGNGDNVLDGWRQLAGQIPIALSAGMGLIPFWSCDISGYCGDIDDHRAMGELYTRWMQFGIFNPLSRAHHEGNHAVEPWLFGPDVEKACRQAIELKYRLFPYLYTAAREAHDSGMPILRALPLIYPRDKEVANLGDEFLFGNDLLIAPVVNKGETFRRLYLPEGNWIDFNNPKICYNGEQWIRYETPLDVIPVFVRQGAIIPTMPVMQFLFETPDYPLIYHLYPTKINPKGCCEVYEDDGETNDYQHGKYRTIRIASSLDGDALTIHSEIEWSGGYAGVSRHQLFIIHTDEKPLRVFLNDNRMKSQPLPTKMASEINAVNRGSWMWDKKQGYCVIHLPEMHRSEKIKVCFR